MKTRISPAFSRIFLSVYAIFYLRIVAKMGSEGEISKNKYDLLFFLHTPNI